MCQLYHRPQWLHLVVMGPCRLEPTMIPVEGRITSLGYAAEPITGLLTSAPIIYAEGNTTV